MKLHAIEIPDDAAAVAEWLERQLIGVELADLAAELAVIHGASLDAADDVRTLLGSKLSDVLRQGLITLDDAEIESLLSKPHYLLQLQELVAEKGGDYWRRKALADAKVERHMIAGEQRLTAAMQSAAATVSRPSTPWYRHPAFVMLATAACLLLTVSLVWPSQPTAIWGPAEIRHDVTAQVYFERLAKGATRWFDERPTSRQDVARNIARLRQDCSNLMTADHSALSEADRAWLLERCRAWATKFDVQLAAVEDGGDPLAARAAMDESVNTLIKALESRAAGLG